MLKIIVEYLCIFILFILYISLCFVIMSSCLHVAIDKIKDLFKGVKK